MSLRIKMVLNGACVDSIQAGTQQRNQNEFVVRGAILHELGA